MHLTYLKSLFSVRTLEYDFRNNRSKLNIPKPRTNYLKRSICYRGALLRNNLPQEIRNLPNLSQFKRATNVIYINVQMIYKILTHSRQSCKAVYFVLYFNVCNTEDFTVDE